LLWAICRCEPGKTLLLFAPGAAGQRNTAVAAAFLTGTGDRRVPGASVHLAQVLLEAGEPALLKLYETMDSGDAS